MESGEKGCNYRVAGGLGSRRTAERGEHGVPKLTKTFVDGLQPPESGELKWWDEGKGSVTGFGVRVRATGRTTWIVQYRTTRGRTRRLTIGTVGRMTPDQARIEARRALAAVDRGEDPVVERKKARSAASVRELVERWRREYAPRLKKSSRTRYEALMRRIILPRLGSHKIEEVTRSDVAAIHHSLRETPVEANRVVALISKLFNLAERWELRPDHTNPARHVERFPEKPRERFLSARELARLGEVLREGEEKGTEHPSMVLGIRLLILTGCRRSEIFRLMWDEVDLATGCLRLEDSKTGAKIVPLGPPAIRLLAGAQRVRGNSYVCWGDTDEGPFIGIDKAWRRIRSAAGVEDLRIHDLRHSFASVAVAGGESLVIIGKVLGHKQTSTTDRYAHLSDDPLRAAAGRISQSVACFLEGDVEETGGTGELAHGTDAGESTNAPAVM
jgi:integrase